MARLTVRFACNLRALNARDASQREVFYLVAVSALWKLVRVQRAR
jgi:hypothetical protein